MFTFPKRHSVLHRAPLMRFLRSVTVLGLGALLFVSPTARPCSTPCVPGSLKSVKLIPESVQAIGPGMATATIRVDGYKTVASPASIACSCALNLPNLLTISDVTAIRMVFTGSCMPVPGFDTWLINGAAMVDWAAALTSGEWKAFVTPATASLPAGTLVSFEFDLTVTVTPPPSTIPPSLVGGCVDLDTGGSPPVVMECPELLNEVLARLTPVLGDSVVGTDEATSLGTLTGNLTAIEGLAPLALGTGIDSFVDLHGELPGTNGNVMVAGAGDLVGGGESSLLLVNALAGSQFALFAGTTAIDAPFKGGVLVPAPSFGLVLPTGTGTVALDFVVPLGIPSGAAFYMQAAVSDVGAVQGVALSNALLGTFQ